MQPRYTLNEIKEAKQMLERNGGGCISFDLLEHEIPSASFDFTKEYDHKQLRSMLQRAMKKLTPIEVHAIVNSVVDEDVVDVRTGGRLFGVSQQGYCNAKTRGLEKLRKQKIVQELRVFLS